MSLHVLHFVVNQPLGLGRLSLPLRVNARAGPTQMSGAIYSGSERRTRPLGRFLSAAFQKHRIAITKEAITLGNGMPVKRMHVLKAGKRRHQHQQAAFG